MCVVNITFSKSVPSHAAKNTRRHWATARAFSAEDDRIMERCLDETHTDSYANGEEERAPELETSRLANQASAEGCLHIVRHRRRVEDKRREHEVQKGARFRRDDDENVFRISGHDVQIAAVAVRLQKIFHRQEWGSKAGKPPKRRLLERLRRSTAQQHFQCFAISGVRLDDDGIVEEVERRLDQGRAVGCDNCTEMYTRMPLCH
eukprot:jgi/Undpi1/6278/HiC_scaffold_20.g08762.m1